MNNIKTYQDLLDAKRQLESDLATHGAQIKVDVVQLKEELKPLAALLIGLGKFLAARTVHPVLSIGANLLGNALIQKILPVKSVKVATALMPMLARGFFNVIKRFKNHAPAVGRGLKVIR